MTSQRAACDELTHSPLDSARGERSLLVLLLLTASSCLTAWDVGGPWACGEGDVCPDGYTCDDLVCCKPGGTPACPTLPLPGGRCADGEPKVYFQDLDGDGDGNEKVSRVFCHPPHKVPGRPVWVLSGGDCDDTRADIFAARPSCVTARTTTAIAHRRGAAQPAELLPRRGGSVAVEVLQVGQPLVDAAIAVAASLPLHSSVAPAKMSAGVVAVAAAEHPDGPARHLVGRVADAQYLLVAVSVAVDVLEVDLRLHRRRSTSGSGRGARGPGLAADQVVAGVAVGADVAFTTPGAAHVQAVRHEDAVSNSKTRRDRSPRAECEGRMGQLVTGRSLRGHVLGPVRGARLRSG